jgi:hypothetical protein
MNYAQAIVKHLGGDWIESCGYGLAPGPGHSKRDRSLKISRHATDRNDVAAHSFAGDDVLALKMAWREEGLLPLPQREPVLPWLWNRSQPADAIVKTYLYSRGIELDPWPQVIRFLPASPPKHPYHAMMVPFGLPDEPTPGLYAMSPERIKGLHLTYLKADGSGKAPVEPSRRIIGKAKGAPLALISPNDGLGLLIAEGAETALSGAIATGLGAWAASSATLMPSLADAVPDHIEAVWIARERDPAGQRGANELGRRLEKRGIEVIMAGRA